jgi:predicted unusual protein kinase regulating ubiquinone biosynthesis (AarF/ABC1/UbiB family)
VSVGSRRTSRLLSLTALAGAAAAGTAVTVAVVRARRARRTVAVAATTRAARTASLAALGSRVGTAAAANRAQRLFASAERREQLDEALQLRTAEEVAAVLGTMKGALMKLGQMASYLDEGVPEPIREALSSLLQDAPPMSGGLAASVITEELGSPPSVLFAEWDPVPMAAASIGQVHRAITLDGVAVAVKVQYPGVDAAIRADLENTGLLFTAVGMMFPGLDPGPLVEELQSRLVEELDYRLEAENQRLFAAAYEGHPFIHVPAVVDSLSARRVLTTELAEGVRFDEVLTWPEAERNLAAEAIFRFVFRSLYRLHAFNGDPHPGNYLFRPGGEVTFLDFGLVKRFEPKEINVFEQMIRTIVLEPDPEAFRRIIEGVGLLQKGASVTTDQVVDYFAHFYEFVREDRVSTMTPEYASDTVRRTFDTNHPVTRFASVPPQFVIIQRINLGLYAILGKLGATANWRRIAEELWPITSGPPSTPLGEMEASWLSLQL